MPELHEITIAVMSSLAGAHTAHGNYGHAAFFLLFAVLLAISFHWLNRKISRDQERLL